MRTITLLFLFSASSVVSADGVLQNVGGNTVYGVQSSTLATNNSTVGWTNTSSLQTASLYTTGTVSVGGSTLISGTISATNGYIFARASTVVTLTNIVYTNVTLDFPSTATLSFSDLLIPVANLKSNDIASINPPAISQTNGIFSSWISNTTLYARYHNYQGSAINPASGIFNVRVEQFK